MSTERPVGHQPAPAQRSRRQHPVRPEGVPAGGTPIGWQERAACRTTVDPDLFFPVGFAGPALRQTEQAIAVCRRCPVQGECLRFALTTGQDFGIWGGTREDQRRDPTPGRAHPHRVLVASPR